MGVKVRDVAPVHPEPRYDIRKRLDPRIPQRIHSLGPVLSPIALLSACRSRSAASWAAFHTGRVLPGFDVVCIPDPASA